MVIFISRFFNATVNGIIFPNLKKCLVTLKEPINTNYTSQVKGTQHRMLQVVLKKVLILQKLFCKIKKITLSNYF